jgi:hypothetical protein
MCRKLMYSISFVLSLVLVLQSTSRADLIGWWRFDEGSGNTAYDTSGNGNDGTLIGNPQWVAGKIGGALEFNGTDSMIDIPYSPDMTPSEGTTMSAWVFPTDDSRSCIVGQFEGYGMALFTGLQLKSVIWGSDWVLNDVIIPMQEWSHIAMTWDIQNSERMIFLNGQLVGQRGDSAVPQVQNNFGIGLWVGWPAAWGDDSFMGIIDDVQVHNIVLVQDEISIIMKGEGYPYAVGPTPEDGAHHEATWVNIAWSAGDYAVSHDVYIGDNFDAVDEGAEGTFVGNQTDTFIVVGFPGFPYPDGLVPGTTYYWRIDEVNESEPNSPWKGKIWSFSIPPKTAYFPDPVDKGEGVSISPQLSWTPGFGAKLHTVYFGETYDEVDSASDGSVQGSASYSPGTLKMAKTYYWRVDEFDVVETHKGDVWSFTTEGAVAALNPANGAVDVTQTPVLTWAPGFGSSYEIFFGTDTNALEKKGSGNLGSESYEPGQLEWNTTYYWRVDEANNANADSPWTGPLWSFTTANFLIIDDMEAYNDLDPADPLSNRVFNAWIDGLGDPTNGSIVGYDFAPFSEQTIVHSGNQSMPMSYDNSTAGKSEATLKLTSNSDWTVNGVTTLTIWFRGDSDNTAEQMYVTLNGSARVDNDNPDAALRTSWTQWNINLQTFADQGVNLSNVNSITLGLSSVTGGTGMLYFDDIRLYPLEQ